MTVTMAGAVKKRTAPQVRIYINCQGWVGTQNPGIGEFGQQKRANATHNI